MRTAALALALLALPACDRNPVADKILSDLAYGVMLPHYRAFAEKAGALRAAAHAFRSSPGPETLLRVRDAWKEARRAWKVCEPHLVGTEDHLLLAAKIETFPIAVDKIEEVLSGSEPVEEPAVELLGTHRKGLLAIEYLAFGGEADAPRRRDFLAALAENVEKVAVEIRDHWEPGRGGFADKFARAGRDRSFYRSREAAIDDVVNRLVLFIEIMADAGLRKPLGMTAADVRSPDPELVAARRSGHSIRDLLANLEGIQALYEGRLSVRMAQGSPEVDASIRQSLASVRRALEEIPEPLERAISEHQEAVLKAFAAIKELRMKFLIDVVAVYKTTLRVVPFDGD